MRKTVSQQVAALFREVAVIVAGVSLALGADDLYQKRQDQVELQRILRSIDADLQADSLAYDLAVDGTLDRSLAAAVSVLAWVEDYAASPNSVELARAIRESIVFPSGLKETTTYREITATGRIGLIRSPELREAILKYYSRPFTGITPEMWGAYVSEISGGYERALRRHMGSTYVDLMACGWRAADYEACLAGSSERLDLNRLRRDPDFVERLVGMTLWAGRFKNLVGLQSREHLVLSAKVREAVGDS